MGDSRKHRGPHPKDRELFASAHHGPLRTAVSELSWLLSRGYAVESSLKLVGDRHGLVARQRMAVRRSACSDRALELRRRRLVALSAACGRSLAVDGFNVLITVESALSGGLVLVGRDGCYRDLASIHGTYRKVKETPKAVLLVADEAARHGITHLRWLLDRPVSNSGQLRGLIAEVLSTHELDSEIALVPDPDAELARQSESLVASSDSWVVESCQEWLNLAAVIIERRVPDAWTLHLEDES